MEIFWQCVEDLGTIDRLLELPHGQEIAERMFRDVAPVLELLEPMKARDPTGAIARLLEFADGVRARIAPDTARMTA
jgi:hypothetical protein